MTVAIDKTVADGPGDPRPFLTKMTIGFRHSLITWLTLAALCVIQPSHADWINLTGSETAPNIAEIYVLDDHVRVVLEVYIGDLDKFMDLVPDDWLNDTSGRPGLEERMTRFSTEGLRIVTASGERLPANLVVAADRPRRCDPGEQHLVDLDHGARRRDESPRAGHRHALHEPGAADEARRGDPGPRDQ